MGIYTDGKEILRDITNLAQGISNIELKNKILELQSTFYELIDENRDLRNKLDELKDVRLAESKLEYRNGVYQMDNGVYCSVCWDKDNKLVRARQIPKDDKQGNKTFYCDACRAWRLSDIPGE